MKRLGVVIVLAALAAVVLSGLAGCGKGDTEQAAAPKPDVFFEGVLVMKNGDNTTRFEAHITRPAQRLVMMDVENPGAIIVRRDLGVVWNLMPAKSVFLETPIRRENKNPLIYDPDEILQREVIGEELVQGIGTVKERIVFKNEGDEQKAITRWMAEGIDWPLKAEADDGSWEMYYDKIVFRTQDTNLFLIPQGYSMITARRHDWPGDK